MTRSAAGLALGTASALVHVAAAVPAALLALLPSGRAAVGAAAVRFAELERTRVTVLLGGVEPGGGPLPRGRAVSYLVVRAAAGLLGGSILFLLAGGVLYASTMLFSWITGTYWVMEQPPSTIITGRLIAYNVLPGIVLLYLGLTGAVGVVRWERSLVRRLLAPTRDELTQRVAVLAESRAAVVAAVDDERRRIERDLHDGVQQRVVALGMLLGRARRHPERATELVEQAHEEAQRVLVDLRDVSWRIYPAALDTGGLAAALESIAERAPLPVHIRCDLAAEPPVTVRAAAWFVVCEAVNNAAKHSAASAVTVDVRGDGNVLRTEVHDDGVGGADPAGGGLAGLARRVAAADGTFSVSSPPGGPTVVKAELPCA